MKVQPELVKKMRRKGRGIGSIFQHYYPEGDWGYVVLLCAFLVQVSQGCQIIIYCDV